MTNDPVSERPSVVSATGGGTLIQLLAICALVSALVGMWIVTRPRSRMSANQNNAGAALKSLVTLESVWRMRDPDGNGVQDYWTRDVAAFHCVHDAAGRPVNMVDVAMASADGARGTAYPEVVSSVPRLGYWFQAMKIDQDGRPYVDSNATPPRVPNAPPGPCTNGTRFGFTAFPAEYGTDGFLVFIVGEDGIVHQHDFGGSMPLLNRKAVDPVLRRGELEVIR